MIELDLEAPSDFERKVADAEDIVVGDARVVADENEILLGEILEVSHVRGADEPTSPLWLEILLDWRSGSVGAEEASGGGNSRIWNSR